MASRRKRRRLNEQVEPAEQAEPPPNRPRKNNSFADRVLPPPPAESAVPPPRPEAPTASGTTNKKRTGRNKTTAARPPPPSRAPHDAIIRELEPRYAVAAPLVISSSKIRARVAAALAHLGPAAGRAPAIVLLHARPRDVCKMITIAEQVKRLVAAAGASWWQYNDMFEPAPRLPPPPDLVEETLLPESGQEAGQPRAGVDGKEGDDDDDDDDNYFETMDSFFENAVLPREEERRERSLRTFLALAPVPELGAKQGVTMQTNARGGGGRVATA